MVKGVYQGDTFPIVFNIRNARVVLYYVLQAKSSSVSPA